MTKKAAKLVSIFTVVPVSALIILTILFLARGEIFETIGWYGLTLVFLVFVPLLAYAVARLIPEYREKGRQAERRLAFMFGVAGQIFGTLTAFALGSPPGVKVIFLSYLLSGILLSMANAVIKHKASGHACGVAGPATLLVYFLGIRFWYVFLSLPVVYWARLKLKRHSMGELVSGSVVGVIATLAVIATYARG